jgi:hypothetical protein
MLFLCSIIGYNILHFLQVGVCWGGWENTRYDHAPENLFGSKYSVSPSQLGSKWIVELKYDVFWLFVVFLFISIFNSLILLFLYRRVILFIIIFVICFISREYSTITSCDLCIYHKNIEYIYKGIASKKINDVSIYGYGGDNAIKVLGFYIEGSRDEPCSAYVILDPNSQLSIPQSARYPRWFRKSEFPGFPMSSGETMNSMKAFEKGSYTLISCF